MGQLSGQAVAFRSGTSCGLQAPPSNATRSILNYCQHHSIYADGVSKLRAHVQALGF